ncbi:hypothetical protein EAI_17017 [Harpegnathos saltator]|uniref:MADF domain-containing protein n=1 Tax=Harpegnathos saltator TaxID=610380 RepID=E2C893_HARSA|nr:hypothetical protein EAI_17017 [Harpegnathos saltator]
MMNYENEMLDSAFDDDNYGNALESETQILVWKTLINLMQPNLILYQKKHKEYNNKSMKMQIWNNIGASLTPPMTGIDAEKTFYRLRQKFGKERRKVIQSQARSGTGANHVPYNLIGHYTKTNVSG